MRLPPERIWNGTTSACRVASHSQIEVGAVDVDPAQRLVGIDDVALVELDAALDHLRDAVGADLRAHAGGHRDVGLELAVADAQRQQQVLGRQALGLDLDLADAALAARHGRAQQPGPLAGLRAHGQRDAAAARPRQAEIDVVEFPLLAVALIEQREIAVLQPELAQVAAVEAGGAEAVDPRQQRGEIRDHAAVGRLRRRRRSRINGLGATPARSAGSRRRRGHERLPVGAGEHRDLAVRLDAHLHLGADQAQPLGAHACRSSVRSRRS